MNPRPSIKAALSSVDELPTLLGITISSRPVFAKAYSSIVIKVSLFVAYLTHILTVLWAFYPFATLKNSFCKAIAKV